MASEKPHLLLLELLYSRWWSLAVALQLAIKVGPLSWVALMPSCSVQNHFFLVKLVCLGNMISFEARKLHFVTFWANSCGALWSTDIMVVVQSCKLKACFHATQLEVQSLALVPCRNTMVHLHKTGKFKSIRLHLKHMVLSEHINTIQQPLHPLDINVSHKSQVSTCEQCSKFAEWKQKRATTNGKPMVSNQPSFLLRESLTW